MATYTQPIKPYSASESDMAVRTLTARVRFFDLIGAPLRSEPRIIIFIAFGRPTANKRAGIPYRSCARCYSPREYLTERLVGSVPALPRRLH